MEINYKLFNKFHEPIVSFPKISALSNILSYQILSERYRAKFELTPCRYKFGDRINIVYQNKHHCSIINSYSLSRLQHKIDAVGRTLGSTFCEICWNSEMNNIALFVVYNLNCDIEPKIKLQTEVRFTFYNFWNPHTDPAAVIRREQR